MLLHSFARQACQAACIQTSNNYLTYLTYIQVISLDIQNAVFDKYYRTVSSIYPPAPSNPSSENGSDTNYSQEYQEHLEPFLPRRFAACRVAAPS